MLRKLLFRGVLGAAAGTTVLLWPLHLPEVQGPAYQELPKVSYAQHPNQHYLSKVPHTVGIIGGGASGLITAKVLKQQGYDVEILEKRSHIGGVWYDNYEGAGLQLPYFTYNMPDFTFPPTTPLIPKQDVILQYFERYIEEFKLKDTIQLSSFVISVKQTADKTWELTLSNGTKKTYDFLVLCTGAFHTPYIPFFDGTDIFKGKMLHSSEFKHAKELCEGKKVVVIGAGKSAMDILELAADHAASVTNIQRKGHWSIPLTFQICGLHPGYTMFSRFTNLLRPAVHGESGWANWVLSPVAYLYWRFIGNKLVKDLPKHFHPESPLEDELDTLVTRNADYTTKLLNGRIAVKRGSIDRFTPNGIVTADGITTEADVVVFATGFSRNYLDLESRGEEQWRHRGIVKPRIKNFAVIGNLSTTNTMLITNLQAVWLAEVMRGKVILPSDDQMFKDINSWKDYMLEKKKGSKKSCLLLPGDWYTDHLLEDMGLQTRRSSRLLDHWFAMGDASNYKSVVTHRV
jgi:cation diffusion facilitator CzcD-associated flavoprotein CzcO